jgi:hypothetical protein
VLSHAHIVEAAALVQMPTVIAQVATPVQGPAANGWQAQPTGVNPNMPPPGAQYAAHPQNVQPGIPFQQAQLNYDNYPK